MKIISIDSGFALYKEKDEIGRCTLTPAPKGGSLWRVLHPAPVAAERLRLLSLKRSLARLSAAMTAEQATVFTAPLPADAGRGGVLGQIRLCSPRGTQLVRRRTPDLTAVRFVQDFLAARLTAPRLCIDATCGNGGDTAFLCGLSAASGGRVLGFDIQPEAIASTRAHLEQQGSRRQSFTATATQTCCSMLQPGTADAVMFNFGWLPGADHAVFSTAEQQHPRAGSGPARPCAPAACSVPSSTAGGSSARTKSRRVLAVAAGTSADKILPYLVCDFANWAETAPLPCLHPEKIAKTLASMCVFC